MSGDKTSTTSSNTSTSFPDWTQTAGKSLFDQASSYFSANPNRPTYQGPWSAAPGAETGFASADLQKMLGGGGDLDNASKAYSGVLGALDPNVSTKDLMNPYVDATLKPTIRNINEAHDTAARGIGASATSAGAFGDTGHAMLAALNDRNTATNIGDATAKANSDAFNNAQTQKNTIMQQIMGAGAGSTGVANARGGINSLLASLGLGQQQIQQQGIQNQLGEFDKSAAYPQQSFASLASLLAMLPKNTSGTSQGSTTSPDNTGTALLGGALSYLL